ncbi:MAG: hypothetical protein EXS55_03420 [Candidatus Magasanikbacteria bacterium]|nr:hypothetical protein [Candidatus Magasanikbacteria bacterium]
MTRSIRYATLLIACLLATPAHSEEKAVWHGLLIVKLKPMKPKNDEDLPRVIFIGGPKWTGNNTDLTTPREQVSHGDRNGADIFWSPGRTVVDEVLVTSQDFKAVLVRDDCVAQLAVEKVSKEEAWTAYGNVHGFVYQVVIPQKITKLEGACAEFRKPPATKRR